MDRPGAGAGFLPALHLSTDAVPPAERLEAWRAYTGAWVDVTLPDDAPPAPFRAEHRMWRVGQLGLKWTRADATISHRAASLARRDQMDHWCFTLPLDGQFRFDFTDQVLPGLPGVPHLFGLHQPGTVRRGPAEYLMLFVPRDALPDAAAALDTLGGRLLDWPLGRLFGHHLRVLMEALPQLPADQAPAAAAATLALLRAAVLTAPAALEEARAPLEAALRARVRAMARAQLASARLTPQRLAGQAGLSRSVLYRLFEGEGGVARMIQRERLRAARRFLLDARERRPVSEVAEAVGMPDASVFGRAFRREFGLPPGALRAEAPPLRAPGPTLDDVLQALRG